jgi:hypothetical protein
MLEKPRTIAGTGSKWDVYCPDSGLATVENLSLPWYNFNSRQTNLSIRHFNNLKSIRGRSPELDWGGFLSQYSRGNQARF